MDINIDALVIRETQSGENDKLITLLTSSLGKIMVLAKGVKSIKSKNASSIQLFCYSDFELSEKSGRYILKTAHAKESFFGIRKDALKFSLASYIIDTAGAVVTENMCDDDTLRLVLNTLFALSERHDIDIRQIKAAYEFKLMQVSGFMPQTDSCFMCGCDIKEGIDVKFSFTESGIICEDCAKKVQSQNHDISFMTIKYKTLLCMQYICGSSVSKFLSFRTSDDCLRELSVLCENYLIFQTERTFSTLKFYKDMFYTLNSKNKQEIK